MTSRLMLLVPLLLPLGCATAPGSAGNSSARAAALVEAYIDHHLERHPDSAVELGLHDADGRFVPPSRENLDADIQAAQKFLAAAEALSLVELADPVRLDLELAILDARRTLFRLQTRRDETKILSYLGHFDVKAYVVRDYAPLAARVEKMLDRIDAATASTDAFLALLSPEQPRSFLETANLAFGGMREYYAQDLSRAVEPALAASPELRARFERSVNGARAAIDRVLAWVKEAQARGTDKFALGERDFLENLYVNEGQRWTLPELKAMAEADHRRNLEAFIATAKKIAPDKTTQQVADLVASEHLRWDDVIPTASRQLDGLLDFIRQKKLVTLPSAARATVAITPTFMRYNSAFLDPAGPFEKAEGSFYYLSPPDPSWSAEMQESYLPYAGDLLATSIHEVYPGHFVHGEKIRLAPSRAQKIFGSYAFTEGWAHYTEEMMIAEGYGGGDLRVKLGQLSNALLRNCRFLAAIGLHTGGMTVTEAETLFREQCYIDAGNARQQAYRGTFDPGYLSYTLGKLQILLLRDKYLAAHPGQSVGDFHDWLLGFGASPLALIEARLPGLSGAGSPAR